MKEICWDTKADVVTEGDNLRDVSPITNRTRVDEIGFTHYVFSKIMFNNPWYVIPDDDLELFKKFMDGGSRSYPSDGNTPCDIVAGEARYIIHQIIEMANNPEHKFYAEAQKTVKNRKYDLVRGTMKLYFGKYTSRDWRRKRYTDDIDFWVYEISLLEHVLKRSGWTKNSDTREWEKKVKWVNLYTSEKKESTLVAANDTNQLLDFGAGSYLEGSGLKEIFSKKIKRGHDVDLSDIINVVMVNGGKILFNREEWRESWNSFVHAANTRSTRITSNIISLIRHALAIADYLERVGRALYQYHPFIVNKSIYPDGSLNAICRTSVHWIAYLSSYGPDATRMVIHDFLSKQAKEKIEYSKNLRSFSKKLIDLLNSKYKYLKINFEIERHLNDAKLIELKDKHLFDKYFLEFQPEISEFTFTNLFIWRHHYNFLFKEWKNHLIVFSKDYLLKWRSSFNNKNDTIFFLPPIGKDPDKVIIELFKNYQNVEIHRVPETIIEKLIANNDFKSLNLDTKEDQNNWDYVYDKQNLLSLPGNSFRQKRRWLNKFLTTNDHEFHIITEDWLDYCKQLQIEWCHMNECQSNENLHEEQDAIFEAFEHYNELSLNGGLILIKGKSIAYTIGEKLNDDTMVIHFEKAHVDYEGSYQAINNLFAKNCCKDVKYINREQDLGIEGIRRAKESYKPHHMVKKYIIFKNGKKEGY